jgi:hypothetical protein
MQPNGAVMKPIAAALVLFLSSVPAWTQSRSEDDGNRPDPPMLGPHLTRGEANRQAHQGGGSPNMIYHNGDIMPTAVTQAIFWGTSWANTSFVGDKISGLDLWYQGVGNSEYGKTCDEYTGLNSDPVTSGISYASHLVDTSTAPSHAPRTSTILNEVCKMVTTPVANGYYAVYVDTPRGGAGYCAWHSWGTCGNVPIQFAFFFNLDGDPGCDPQSTVAGHSQGLAALANVTGHELSEARTDPRGAGWFDSSGAENGDKCAWSFGSSQVTFSNGTSWKIQGNWSNIAYNQNLGYANTSGQHGCLDGGNYMPVAQ